MYCNKCGKKNSSDAKYCYECGTCLNVSEKSSNNSLILGIISISTSAFSGLISLITGVISIVFNSKEKKITGKNSVGLYLSLASFGIILLRLLIIVILLFLFLIDSSYQANDYYYPEIITEENINYY